MGAVNVLKIHSPSILVELRRMPSLHSWVICTKGQLGLGLLEMLFQQYTDDLYVAPVGVKRIKPLCGKETLERVAWSIFIGMFWSCTILSRRWIKALMDGALNISGWVVPLSGQKECWTAHRRYKVWRTGKILSNYVVFITDLSDPWYKQKVLTIAKDLLAQASRTY